MNLSTIVAYGIAGLVTLAMVIGVAMGVRAMWREASRVSREIKDMEAIEGERARRLGR